MHSVLMDDLDNLTLMNIDLNSLRKPGPLKQYRKKFMPELRERSNIMIEKNRYRCASVLDVNLSAAHTLIKK